MIRQRPVEGGIADRQRRDVGDYQCDVMAALGSRGSCLPDRLREHVARHYLGRVESETFDQRPREATPAGAGIEHVSVARHRELVEHPAHEVWYPLCPDQLVLGAERATARVVGRDPVPFCRRLGGPSIAHATVVIVPAGA